jgi:hypothetical protein
VSHDKITPYIVGIEPDSVLIDITDIRHLHELKSFLASHNTDTEFHFFGGLLLERKYLNSRFIETKWNTTSPHYKKLISEALKLMTAPSSRAFLVFLLTKRSLE